MAHNFKNKFNTALTSLQRGLAVRVEDEQGRDKPESEFICLSPHTSWHLSKDLAAPQGPAAPWLRITDIQNMGCYSSRALIRCPIKPARSFRTQIYPDHICFFQTSSISFGLRILSAFNIFLEQETKNSQAKNLWGGWRLNNLGHIWNPLPPESHLSANLTTFRERCKMNHFTQALP